jgi:hypothetical protein
MDMDAVVFGGELSRGQPGEGSGQAEASLEVGDGLGEGAVGKAAVQRIGEKGGLHEIQFTDEVQ